MTDAIEMVRFNKLVLDVCFETAGILMFLAFLMVLKFPAERRQLFKSQNFWLELPPLILLIATSNSLN